MRFIGVYPFFLSCLSAVRLLFVAVRLLSCLLLFQGAVTVGVTVLASSGSPKRDWSSRRLESFLTGLLPNAERLSLLLGGIYEAH